MRKDRSVIDIAWDTYAAQIKEAIEQGFLDDEIRKIARTCFDRRDVIKDAEQLHGDRDPQERNVLPQNPVREEVADEPEKVSGESDHFKYEEATAITLRRIAMDRNITVLPGSSKASIIVSLRQYDANEQAKAEAAVYSEPSKARGTNAKTGSVPKSKPKRAGRPVVSKTFEYAGRIYNAAEVRGRIFQYQETGAGGKRYWGKITGCGPKSIKVTWVHDNTGTPCADGHVGCCPVKYRDPKASDGRKVTFMGHSYIEPIINSLTPIGIL